MKKLFWVILFFGVATQLEMKGQETNVFPTAEKLRPFSNKDVELTASWIKQREDLNVAWMESLEPDRLLHNFRVIAGLPSNAKPLEGWEAPHIGLRGHFVGHYLSTVAFLTERYTNTRLSHNLEYIVKELYKCQQANGNGYLSAFPETDFDVLETRFTGVWAPYYTYHKIMQGLLDVYIHTGNRKAYKMLEAMADYVEGRMSKLSSECIKQMMYTPQANPSNEMGGMNEVLYELYRISGNLKYLNLAGLFDPAWFLEPLVQHEDILSGLHSNTHIILVNGFAQRYEATRDEKYKAAIVNFWDILMRGHTYANGTSSGPRPVATTDTSRRAEHWGDPGYLCTLSREIAESCVTHNTQRLNSYLFTWTGDPRYADTYMNMFYNAVLPVQSTSTGAYVYNLPLGSPRHKKYLKENDFMCCSGSCIEAYSKLNSGIYYHDDSAIYVNQYIPSKVYWKERNVLLEQDGNFPKKPVVDFTLSIKRSEDFALKLFVPSWAEGVEVYVNEERQNVEANPSSFLKIERRWSNRDKVRVEFRYGFHLKTMPGKENMLALFYGPMMLAFETESEVILRDDKDKILKGLSKIDGKEGSFILRDGEKEYKLRPLFDIDGQSYGVYATIRNF